PYCETIVLACLGNSPNHDSSSLDTDNGITFLSSKMCYKIYIS
ncbi:17723_t:CDS:1, partial [Racocetra persica]